MAEKRSSAAVKAFTAAHFEALLFSGRRDFRCIPRVRRDETDDALVTRELIFNTKPIFGEVFCKELRVLLNPLEIRFCIFDAFRLCAAVNDFIQCADVFVRPLFGGLICRTHFTLFPFGLCRGRCSPLAVVPWKPLGFGWRIDCPTRGLHIYIPSQKGKMSEQKKLFSITIKKYLITRLFFV